MCSLCGVLGGQGHWADPASNPEAFEDRGQSHTRYRERQLRTGLTNKILKHYGLKVSDWSGHAFVLRSLTGQTQLVENLAELWPAAEKLSASTTRAKQGRWRRRRYGRRRRRRFKLHDRPKQCSC